MVKITMNVEGMACGMCEKRVNETIKEAFKVKEVTSDHMANKTEIIAKAALDEAALKAAVEGLGFNVSGVTTEGMEKKGFSLFRK